MYIIFEGPIGSGKTTQLALVVEQLKKLYPDQEFVTTREPGGTPEAEEIRKIVKTQQLSPFKEAGLYAHARQYLIEGVVKPSLKRGAIVFSDRSFISSLAYQGGGRELGLEDVWALNKYIVEDVIPDVVVYYDVGLDVCLSRSKSQNPDKFDNEPREFAHRVQRGYENAFELLKCLGSNTKIIRVNDPDGLMSVETTTDLVVNELSPLIELWQAEGKIRRERQS